jgi:hypothetical protein
LFFLLKKSEEFFLRRCANQLTHQLVGEKSPEVSLIDYGTDCRRETGRVFEHDTVGTLRRKRGGDKTLKLIEGYVMGRDRTLPSTFNGAGSEGKGLIAVGLGYGVGCFELTTPSVYAISVVGTEVLYLVVDGTSGCSAVSRI